MANKKLNSLETKTEFDHAYVELDSNQYRITKANLGKQLSLEVHTSFSEINSKPDYILVEDTQNSGGKISLRNLTKAIINDTVFLHPTLSGNKMIYDGCFIMYHPRPTKQTDSWPRIATYAEWPSLQLFSGEEADGVLIVEGGHFLLVAPHEKKCFWSSKYGLASHPDEIQEYKRNNRITMLNTWNGQERTERICTSSSFSADSNPDSSYAPGYCYNYTPHTEIDSSTGKPKPGLRPNQYWLPCVAELMLICAHKDKINAGLALIKGANQLLSKEEEGTVNYWTSIEDGTKNAWYINLKNGYLRGLMNKKKKEAMARPVSTFAQSSLVGAG